MLAKVETLYGKIITKMKWKTISNLLFVICILGLLPLLGIAFYNYPSADDFSMGEACFRVWKETHNIFPVLGQALKLVADDYLHWEGYYFNVFMDSLPPSIFGERMAFFVPVVNLLGLGIGSWLLCYGILRKGFGAEGYVTRAVWAVLFFLQVQTTMGRVEAFYWNTGAVNYTFALGMCLCYLGLLAWYGADRYRNRARGKGLLIGTSVVGFLAAGGGQMGILNTALILIAVIIVLSINKLWGRLGRIYIPMAVYFFGFLLNVCAPGNWQRSEITNGMNPIKAVMVSFYYAFDYCLSEWTAWVVPVLLLLLVPFFWIAFEKTNFAFRLPGLVIAFSYCLVSAMMTPPLFGVGNLAAGRLQSVTYMNYLMWLVIDTAYVTGWIQKKITWKQEKDRETAGKTLALLTAAFFVFGSLLCVGVDGYYYSATSALTDLVNGKAAGFAKEQEARLVVLRDESVTDPVFEELENQPELLFYDDIKTDPEDWINRAMARYYGKNTVVRTSRPPQAAE